jgi:hypothetical protein
VTEANGIERLQKALAQTDDSILKVNISGILYMFSTPAVETRLF